MELCSGIKTLPHRTPPLLFLSHHAPVPPTRFSISPDIRLCLSLSATINVATTTTTSTHLTNSTATASTTSSSPPILSTTNSTASKLPLPLTVLSHTTTKSLSPPSPSPTPPPPPPTPPSKQPDPTLPSGIIKRNFLPIGSAAYNFILVSAYRGGHNTFAITGLSSKPLHDYGHPTYHCSYIPDSPTPTSTPITTPGTPIPNTGVRTWVGSKWVSISMGTVHQ